MEQTLKLTVLKNGKEETFETECCDIPFETTEKLLEVLNLDFSKFAVDKNGGSMLEFVELTSKVLSAINEIKPIILFIFPELEADDLKKCSTKEIVKVACKAILFTLKDCFGELKNELMTK